MNIPISFIPEEDEEIDQPISTHTLEEGDESKC